MSIIEWTEKTWNPIVGCSKVSPGCDNCYAERMAIRLAHIPGATGDQYSDVIGSNMMGGYHWDGKTALVESALTKPLHWKKPRMIFVCSMGDLFHESVPFEWIDKVFAVMALCPQHTFQVLTKRPARMLEYFEMLRTNDSCFICLQRQASRISKSHAPKLYNNAPVSNWPLPNVWLGVTAEDQQRADERIPDLLKCPAAKRFISVEPILGAVDLAYTCFNGSDSFGTMPGIDWVICGGESGPGARPMHPDWARSLRGQCDEAGVAFFFKQWGEWFPRDQWEHNPELILPDDNGYATDSKTIILDGHCPMHRVGKKKAGRLLDGVKYNEYPTKS